MGCSVCKLFSLSLLILFVAKNNALVEEICIARMQRLAELAEERAKEGSSLSKGLEKRYVKIARKISSHYKVSMPKEIDNKICKKCNNLLVPGINCSVRLATGGYLVYKCECGAEKHVYVISGRTSRARA